ncbi:unnamed protein product [Owenia fusiformis]|uniref:EGF-like domain-containing protein n=1 Tax=Owenia fusiformis TaxID=6347 RepID=A0A8S4QBR8_OWEFU|nr:unnamed protein product [Owenia fusiformis]
MDELNGIYVETDTNIDTLQSYTRESPPEYNIYFKMDFINFEGRWLIDNNLSPTYFDARSNIFKRFSSDIGKDPTAWQLSWELLGDSKWVEQRNAKWSCVDDIDDCKDSSCENGGSCIDGVDSYSCNCVSGYTGRRCETNIDDCPSSPCTNPNQRCIDGLNSYTCACKEGFTGSDCETDIDECQSDPCSNGGSCIDEENGYECNCVPGYAGADCETASAAQSVGQSKQFAICVAVVLAIVDI